MVQLSHPYMTTGKTVILTVWAFVSKVTSLLFNTLSRFVIAFFQEARALISWLQSLSTVILELKKIKSVTVFIFPPSVCHEVMGPDAIILVFFFFFYIFECCVLSQTFPSPLSPSSRGSLVPLYFLPLAWYDLHI